MATYSLNPNRPTPYKVIEYSTEYGKEGVYSGSYEDCEAYIAEQCKYSIIGIYDIVPNIHK